MHHAYMKNACDIDSLCIFELCMIFLYYWYNLCRIQQFQLKILSFHNETIIQGVQKLTLPS